LELSTILSVLGAIQTIATLVLIPVVRIIWDIRVYMEKDKIIKDIILKEIEDLKQRIKEFDNEEKKSN
jgi:hypothetical protein